MKRARTPSTNETSPEKTGPSPATAFDDYVEEDQNKEACKRVTHFHGMRLTLRALSAISFGLAITSACVVLALDWFHFFEPDVLAWRLKSAFPLIFIGISYGCLQFTLSRSRKEFILSVAVGVAFILWGIEQFLPDPAFVLLMDDVVMFLFVLDLGVVIRGHLKHYGT